MRTRIALAVAALALLPLGAPADDDGGDPESRLLATGKLFAAASHDFSCSLVNKDPSENVTVTLELKNPDGTTYINPSTFQPATLQTTLAPFEAAMLTAPAAFGGGQTTLYCWADVPFEAIVFGAFLVRDGQDRATAAVPLKEDVVAAARSLDAGLEDIHAKIDALGPGPVTGRMGTESCFGPRTVLPEELLESTIGCFGSQLATGGGCRVLDASGQGQPGFSTYRDSPSGIGSEPGGWQCRWRNNNAVSVEAEFCVDIVCADALVAVE